jgi:hypothetical protein
LCFYCHYYKRHFLFYFLLSYCCHTEGYNVTFIKVLTIYHS